MMVDGYVKKFSKRKTLMSAMLTKLSNSFMKGRSYMKLRSNSNSIAKRFIEPDDKHRRKKNVILRGWKSGGITKVIQKGLSNLLAWDIL